MDREKACGERQYSVPERSVVPFVISSGVAVPRDCLSSFPFGKLTKFSWTTSKRRTEQRNPRSDVLWNADKTACARRHFNRRICPTNQAKEDNIK